MMKIFLPILITFIAGCSSINQSEQEYYQEHKTMRHGIVPEVNNEGFSKKKWNESLSLSAIQEGKKLYQAHCIQCHGPEGRGNGPEGQKLTSPPTDLTKVANEVPNFKFFMLVSKWHGQMPGWKHKFNPAEVEHLEQYIRSLANSK